MRKPGHILGMLLAALSVLAVPPCSAAETYPSLPITLIVPYPPGGGIDPAARVYADALAKALDAKIIIQNQGGASGMIGTARVARSAPDGYTLLFGSVAPNVILPAAYPSELNYDARKDFAPIGLIAQADYVLLASSKLPVNSFKDLIDYAKKQSTPIAYASSGQLSGPHLAGELLSKLAGVKMMHVPYRGNGPALTALMSGEVSFMFDSAGGVASRGTSDKYKVLAVTGGQPYTDDPSVPNLGTLYPGHDVSQWYGLMAQADTPPEILKRLRAAHDKAVHSPELQRRYKEMGLDVITDSSPAKFQAYIDSEITRWQRILTTQNVAIPKL
ncbi:MAG TPA: tripartite tricarboxylate transporter substrate-binding protein [Bordetella sp.]|jgi:tripartite-type tricarboxylate transporter receptor subunit TctC|nr:tripartite tricarboxylate transporter substrate-binding protein [Bordetella sp.]